VFRVNHFGFLLPLIKSEHVSINLSLRHSSVLKLLKVYSNFSLL
jgi:hypothetical protein